MANDYKIMELYNQISILCQNNIGGRYDDKIRELRAELAAILEEQKER